MLYCYLCNMYMWVHLHRFPALFSALTLTVTCTTVQENKRKEVVNIASKWQEQSEQIRAKLGVVDARPWTKLISNRYTALPQTKRVLEILDLGALDHILSKSSAGTSSSEKQIRNCMKGVFVDVSQNPARQPWTSPDSGISHCLTTGSHIYSYEHDRCLLPIEMLLCQGHSTGIKVPEKVSQTQLRTIAGEGICLPCLGMILHGLAVSGTW